MEALVVIVFVASVLGMLWHAHRGEHVGWIEGARPRRFGRERRLKLQVRRVGRATDRRVQISGFVYAVYRSATVSAQEASQWAEALERYEPCRCGGLEIARQEQTAQGGRILVTVPLDFNRYRLGLLLDLVAAREAARSLRAAAG